jgi:hypothetical protein
MGTKDVAKGAADTVKAALDKGAEKAKVAVTPTDLHGPSPNAATNLAIADIAMRSGTVLARRAVERAMLGARYSDGKAKKILKGRSLTETLLHGVLARVALRSVPGAILVGGGLVAKTLYDRSQAGKARRKGEAELHQQALDGESGGEDA